MALCISTGMRPVRHHQRATGPGTSWGAGSTSRPGLVAPCACAFNMPMCLSTSSGHGWLDPAISTSHGMSSRISSSHRRPVWSRVKLVGGRECPRMNVRNNSQVVRCNMGAVRSCSDALQCKQHRCRILCTSTPLLGSKPLVLADGHCTSMRHRRRNYIGIPCSSKEHGVTPNDSFTSKAPRPDVTKGLGNNVPGTEGTADGVQLSQAGMGNDALTQQDPVGGTEENENSGALHGCMKGKAESTATESMLADEAGGIVGAALEYSSGEVDHDNARRKNISTHVGDVGANTGSMGSTEQGGYREHGQKAMERLVSLRHNGDNGSTGERGVDLGLEGDAGFSEWGQIGTSYRGADSWAKEGQVDSVLSGAGLGESAQMDPTISTSRSMTQGQEAWTSTSVKMEDKEQAGSGCSDFDSSLARREGQVVFSSDDVDNSVVGKDASQREQKWRRRNRLDTWLVESLDPDSDEETMNALISSWTKRRQIMKDGEAGNPLGRPGNGNESCGGVDLESPKGEQNASALATMNDERDRSAPAYDGMHADVSSSGMQQVMSSDKEAGAWVGGGSGAGTRRIAGEGAQADERESAATRSKAEHTTAGGDSKGGMGTQCGESPGAGVETEVLWGQSTQRGAAVGASTPGSGRRETDRVLDNTGTAVSVTDEKISHVGISNVPNAMVADVGSAHGRPRGAEVWDVEVLEVKASESGVADVGVELGWDRADVQRQVMVEAAGADTSSPATGVSSSSCNADAAVESSPFVRVSDQCTPQAHEFSVHNGLGDPKADVHVYQKGDMSSSSVQPTVDAMEFQLTPDLEPFAGRDDYHGWELAVRRQDNGSDSSMLPVSQSKDVDAAAVLFTDAVLSVGRNSRLRQFAYTMNAVSVSMSDGEMKSSSDGGPPGGITPTTTSSSSADVEGRPSLKDQESLTEAAQQDAVLGASGIPEEAPQGGDVLQQAVRVEDFSSPMRASYQIIYNSAEAEAISAQPSSTGSAPQPTPSLTPEVQNPSDSVPLPPATPSQPVNLVSNQPAAASAGSIDVEPPNYVSVGAEPADVREEAAHPPPMSLKAAVQAVAAEQPAAAQGNKSFNADTQPPAQNPATALWVEVGGGMDDSDDELELPGERARRKKQAMKQKTEVRRDEDKVAGPATASAQSLDGADCIVERETSSSTMSMDGIPQMPLSDKNEAILAAVMFNSLSSTDDIARSAMSVVRRSAQSGVSIPAQSSTDGDPAVLSAEGRYDAAEAGDTAAALQPGTHQQVQVPLPEKVGAYSAGGQEGPVIPVAPADSGGSASDAHTIGRAPSDVLSMSGDFTSAQRSTAGGMHSSLARLSGSSDVSDTVVAPDDGGADQQSGGIDVARGGTGEASPLQLTSSPGTARVGVSETDAVRGVLSGAGHSSSGTTSEISTHGDGQVTSMQAGAESTSQMQLNSPPAYKAESMSRAIREDVTISAQSNPSGSTASAQSLNTSSSGDSSSSPAQQVDGPAFSGNEPEKLKGKTQSASSLSTSSFDSMDMLPYLSILSSLSPTSSLSDNSGIPASSILGPAKPGSAVQGSTTSTANIPTASDAVQARPSTTPEAAAQSPSVSSLQITHPHGATSDSLAPAPAPAPPPALVPYPAPTGEAAHGASRSLPPPGPNFLVPPSLADFTPFPGVLAAAKAPTSSSSKQNLPTSALPPSSPGPHPHDSITSLSSLVLRPSHPRSRMLHPITTLLSVAASYIITSFSWLVASLPIFILNRLTSFSKQYHEWFHDLDAWQQVIVTAINVITASALAYCLVGYAVQQLVVADVQPVAGWYRWATMTVDNLHLRDLTLEHLAAFMQRFAEAPLAMKFIVFIVTGLPLIITFGVAHSLVTGDQQAKSFLKMYGILYRVPGVKVMNEQTVGGLTISNLMFFIGLTLFAVVLGFVTDDVKTLMNSVRNGNFTLHHSNHVLVLNWNNNTVPMLRQFAGARQHFKDKFWQKQVIVLADKPKEWMDAEIAAGLQHTPMAVHTRSAAPPRHASLQSVSAQRAHTVILMHPEGVGEQTAEALKASTLMKLNNIAMQPLNLVVEVPAELPAEADVLSAVKRLQLTGLSAPNINMVLFRDPLVTRLMGQTVFQPGVISVYRNLIQHSSGCARIMFADLPKDSLPCTYGQVRRSFSGACVLGLLEHNQDSGNHKVMFNPADSFMVDEQFAKIVMLSSTGSTPTPCVPASTPDVYQEAAQQAHQRMRRTNHYMTQGKHIIICCFRYSPEMEELLDSMAEFAPEGSSVVLLGKGVPEAPAGRKGNCRFSYHETEYPASYAALASAGIKKADAVMLTGLSHMNSIDADSHVLAALCQVHDAALNAGRRNSVPHVVARIRRPSTLLTASQYADQLGECMNKAGIPLSRPTYELVLMEDLLCSMMLQVAEEPCYERVMASLIESAEGEEVYLFNPAIYNLEPGSTVPFAEVVESARIRQQTAMGYIRKGGQVTLAPEADAMYSVQEGDRIVVISEDFKCK